MSDELRARLDRPSGFLPGTIYGTGGNALTAADEATVAAVARALVRTGMYIDAHIDTSARLDKPSRYAAALLTDPELREDGVYFVSLRRDSPYLDAERPFFEEELYGGD